MGFCAWEVRPGDEFLEFLENQLGSLRELNMTNNIAPHSFVEGEGVTTVQ